MKKKFFIVGKNMIVEGTPRKIERLFGPTLFYIADGKAPPPEILGKKLLAVHDKYLLKKILKV